MTFVSPVGQHSAVGTQPLLGYGPLRLSWENSVPSDVKTDESSTRCTTTRASTIKVSMCAPAGYWYYHDRPRTTPSSLTLTSRTT